MPNFAIMRSRKITSAAMAGRSLGHCFRDRDTPNADPTRTGENDHHAAASTSAAMGAMRALLPEKRRKDAVIAVEYLMTASPDWWKTASRSQQDAFFERSRAWLADKYGADRVIVATVHRDETSPHLSAYVVPLTRDGRLSAKEFIGNKAQMTKDQTTFAAKHADLGLVRGIEGSKAKHQSIRQYYATLTAPTQPLAIQPQDLTPRVLEQRMLSKTVETPEQVADRVNQTLAKASAPLLARAQAAEATQTKAKAAIEAAAALQGRLGAFYTAFLKGLRPEQQQELAGTVAGLRRENEERERKDKVEVERQRRVDALPGLLRTKAGAVATFAQQAIEAIKAKAGNWRQVDWETVGRRAFTESVQEHRQPPASAVEAVLRHSPAHADTSETVIQRTLAEVRQRHPEPDRPEKGRDAGLER